VISIVSGDDTLQRRELDDETLRRASIVAAHSKQIARDQNQGDLSIPVSTGILQWDQIYDLSELVAGRAPRRTHEGEITVFKNNVGLGLQFAAVAGRVYELAQRAGVGRSLPDAWFLEKLKP
jgi:ornithine cyclodeaminase/alanine dehydrogenase-like protein (mu-crystallin family)